LGKINLRSRGAALALCAATAVALPAQTFTTLYNFHWTDGASPNGALVQGSDGNLYGTTIAGGDVPGCEEDAGCGTVFRISPSGALTTLSNAVGNPVGGLVQAADGNFYGVAGEGFIFKITPSGTLTTLYVFCAHPQEDEPCTDGANPMAGLVQATDGDFYGTTLYGGAYYGGNVFKITPGGTLTTLYSFCSQFPDCPDGYEPEAALIQATDGNFYGTTSGGVFAVATPRNGGTVFKITPGGSLTTLHSFCLSCGDGSNPTAGLVQGSDGNLYGTTVGGGSGFGCPNDLSGLNRVFGCGTVFKITMSGTLTTLYSFCPQGNCADGASPGMAMAEFFDMPGTALVQGSDGNFYGTAAEGGAYGNGTVFKITPNGTLTTLYSLDDTDGQNPTGLIQAANGTFYGTTAGNFDLQVCPDDYPPNACGTIFSLSMESIPSVPAVNPGGVLNSASYTIGGAAPGSIVSIFGTNLAASTSVASAIPLPTALSDVTSVTLNGIPAGLYFVSPNQINAQIPFDVLPGQSSGTVSIVVTRSSGTSAPQNVTVVPVSPGIFTTTANGSGQAFAYDNTTGAVAAPAGASIGSLGTAPISIGSGHALIIACTGLGSVNPSIDDYLAPSDGILRYTVLTPTVLIGGVAATPIYSVLSPQFVSEYQIGVTPAANTPTGDAVSLQIQIGGVTTTNQVTIAVAP
jgi:uncharacterized protein (TIGR03437 family)